MSHARSREIAQNLNNLKSELGDKTKLVAVSKTWPIEDVRYAYDAGQRVFGENKAQELLEKSQELKDLEEIEWHFIGRLQTNKINTLLKCPKLASIHSIDSIKLLNKLLKKPIDIDGAREKLGLFLQVNTSEEGQKGGFEELEQLKDAASLIRESNQFRLQGLMTIGSIRSDDFEGAAQECFSRLASLRDEIDPKLELSMGMSQDYRIAIDKGADWVRIGGKIFGRRT